MTLFSEGYYFLFQGFIPCVPSLRGKIGAGGIIRDHNRDLIYAYATPLGQGTNNQAEVESAILGLSWCHRNNIQQFILEVNSKLLIR
ncbi:hypothetical protein P3L10_027935 [Capsicum annuum]